MMGGRGDSGMDGILSRCSCLKREIDGSLFKATLPGFKGSFFISTP
tara:strand:+ start:2315 stop:2452 length:138 start_codon:yes stop_codon:yes gene_type:complete